jgi:hypothetical protein
MLPAMNSFRALLLVLLAETPTPPKFHIYPHNTTHSKRDKMRNIHRIPEAIADLDTQEVPNVKYTAEKYVGNNMFHNIFPLFIIIKKV